MKWSECKPPIWYLLTMSAVLIGLIYFSMILPYLRLSAGIPFDTNLYPNLNIWEKAPPVMPYTHSWDSLDVVGGLICLFLGLICFALGIARRLNQLECKQVFLLALFSALFSLNTLSMTVPASQMFNSEFLFYIYFIAFFAYPIAMLLHFLTCMRTAVYRWMLYPVLLLAVYSVAAWVTYFVFGLPLDIPDKLYTPISAACAILFLVIGSFGAESKAMIRYMRIISISWICWVLYLLLKTWQGLEFFIYDEFKTAITLSSVFMMCYTLFLNMRELAGYRSDLRMLEMKNGFLMENYKTLESHFTQIAQMKHEMRNHLFALRTLYENNDTEQLGKYLSDMQGGYADMEEPISCNNLMIQAVLSYTSRIAEGMGVEMDIDLSPIPPLTIPDTDIVSLFMNLLNNALESCAEVTPSENRRIKVRLKYRSPYLYLSVINTRQGEILADKGRYVSAKKNLVLHGHGIDIVRSIADKHNGFSEFEHTDDTFIAEVALRVD